MTKFDPQSWVAQGNILSAASEDFYASCWPVISAAPLKNTTGSELDAAIVQGNTACASTWHQLIAAMREASSSEASKVIATGEDYAASEEDATEASDRFWR